MSRFFHKIGVTWELMRASLQVLRNNKSLMVFPVLSGLACLVVIASFALPLWRTGFLEGPAEDASAAVQAAYYAVLFAFYFCNYFVIIFFNSALLACAMVGLNGGKLTVGDGLKLAASRLPAIVGWAAVSATVGLVLAIIEDRSETAGKIVASLLGTAWTMVTFLALPVLVVERRGPFGAFKRSASLLKETWGEQVMGTFGFGMMFSLVAVPGIILIMLVGGALGVPPPLWFAAMVLFVLLLATLQSVLHSIFRAALYLYAINRGDAPPGFGREDLLRGAMEAR